MPEYPVNTVLSPPGEIWLGSQGYPVYTDGSSDNWPILQQALNDAAASNPKKVVRLPPGVIGFGTWLSVPPGTVLRGVKGTSTASYDMDNDWGSVLKPLASFRVTGAPVFPVGQPSSATQNPGALVMDGATGAVCHGVRMSDFWLDGRNLPTSSRIDGICGTGQVRAFAAERVGVFSMPGRGIAAYQVTAQAATQSPDGWHLLLCHSNTNWQDGLWGKFTDSSAYGCHLQNNGASGAGDGLYCCGSNNRWTACRADLNVNGMTFDAPASGGGYSDPSVLVGCTSQRNSGHGAYITNTSANGASARSPVLMIGCCWDEDGSATAVNGSTHYAGVRVEGTNIVHIAATSTLVGTVDFASGCPQHALSVGKVAGGTADPRSVVWTSGDLNYAAPSLVPGASAVYDPDSFGPFIGAAVFTAQGYQSAAYTQWSTTSWQRVAGGAGFQNGWADSGNGDPCAFRYVSETNSVEIIGDLTPPSFATSSVIFTLPGSLLPAAVQNFPLVVISTTGAAQALTPRVFIGTNGQVTATNVPGSGSGATTRVFLRAVLSLDV